MDAGDDFDVAEELSGYSLDTYQPAGGALERALRACVFRFVDELFHVKRLFSGCTHAHASSRFDFMGDMAYVAVALILDQH